MSDIQPGSQASVGCRAQAGPRPTLAELMSKNSQARSELKSFKEQLMASIKSDSKQPKWAPLADVPADDSTAKPREASALSRNGGSWEGRPGLDCEGRGGGKRGDGTAREIMAIRYLSDVEVALQLSESDKLYNRLLGPSSRVVAKARQGEEQLAVQKVRAVPDGAI